MLRKTIACSALILLSGGCGDPVPSEVEGYRERCIRLNKDPIPRYDGDPHAGNKNVYACGVDMAFLMNNTRPFPAGTMIIKESTRENEDFPWLLATTQKQAAGGWHWIEYTRNFEDEPLRRILAGQGVCTGCHKRAEPADWIYTTFQPR